MRNIILFSSVLAFLFIDVSAQNIKVSCQNLIPQSGLNVSKLVGKWNVIKTSLDFYKKLNSKEDEVDQECLKFHLIDLFPVDEKYVAYMTWTSYDDFVAPYLRLYGVDPNKNEPGKWTVTTSLTPGEMAEIRILHTDYKNLLSVSCDGESVYAVTMMSREKTLSNEMIEAYLHYLATFDIDDIHYVDFKQDSCSNE